MADDTPTNAAVFISAAQGTIQSILCEFPKNINERPQRRLLEKPWPPANDEGASKKKGTRVSQTPQGFRKVTTISSIATGHLRHIRDHYRIETRVKTTIPLLVKPSTLLWSILPLRKGTQWRREYESYELAEGLKRLEEGFPETLDLDIFCDKDILIKVGLSKGIDNFPNIDLATLPKNGKSVVPNQVSYLEVISGNRLLSEILAPEAPSFSLAPTPIVGISSQPMGPEERSSPLLPIPILADQMAINLEVLSPEPSPVREMPLSRNLPYRTSTWDVTEGSSRATKGLASWESQERGFENSHLFFVDLPYTLLLGLQVTQDTGPSRPTPWP
ncbi:hypothetical protein LIER_12772 [Lithospermum erythrorhizon]|uniref:Uncharacterized protein n=1 Tax=Lithospermum erythrorhizon TaxID=34254 RepID=A0AAV3PTS1_LITER